MQLTKSWVIVQETTYLLGTQVPAAWSLMTSGNLHASLLWRWDIILSRPITELCIVVMYQVPVAMMLRKGFSMCCVLGGKVFDAFLDTRK